MAQVLLTSNFLHHRTLCSFARLFALKHHNRCFSVTHSVHKENEDGGSKADEARRKLAQLLRETRGNKHLKESKPSTETSSKKVKLVKPKLKKFDGIKVTENVDGLDPQAVYAAHRVAESLDSNQKNIPIEKEDKRQSKIRKVESDLLKKLKSVHTETVIAKNKGEAAAQKDLKSLFSSLQVFLFILHQNYKPNAKIIMHALNSVNNNSSSYLYIDRKRSRSRRKDSAW